MEDGLQTLKQCSLRNLNMILRALSGPVRGHCWLLPVVNVVVRREDGAPLRSRQVTVPPVASHIAL